MRNFLGNKKRVAFLLMTLLSLAACKQRDDYPDFSNLKPPVVPEDIIPQDNDMTALSKKIQAKVPYFKTFLVDSTIMINPGIEYTHLRFLNNLDQKISVHIVEMDKSKAALQMETLSPYNDYLYSTQGLPEMMGMGQESIKGKLVVGIVGDNHSSGTPSGSYVKNGRVIKVNPSFTLPHIGVKKGSKDILFLNSPTATVASIVPAEYQSLIAGQNWLIYGGVDINNTLTTVRSSSGIGVSADNQKLYCITVDGVNDFSAGVNLNNFRELFKAMDCHTAFYTNGTASSSLAIRIDNYIMLKNFPQSGAPIGIANAVGFVVGN